MFWGYKGCNWHQELTRNSGQTICRLMLQDFSTFSGAVGFRLWEDSRNTTKQFLQFCYTSNHSKTILYGYEANSTSVRSQRFPWAESLGEHLPMISNAFPIRLLKPLRSQELLLNFTIKEDTLHSVPQFHATYWKRRFPGHLSKWSRLRKGRWYSITAFKHGYEKPKLAIECYRSKQYCRRTRGRVSGAGRSCRRKSKTSSSGHFMKPYNDGLNAEIVPVYPQKRSDDVGSQAKMKHKEIFLCKGHIVQHFVQHCRTAL